MGRGLETVIGLYGSSLRSERSAGGVKNEWFYSRKTGLTGR